MKNKDEWYITITEIGDNYKDLISDFDFNIKKYSFKKLIEISTPYLTKYSDYFYIKEWNIQYMKYNIDTNKKNIISNENKVIFKDNFIKSKSLEDEEFFVLRFEKSFKKKKNEELCNILYEEIEKPNIKTLDSLVSSSYFPKTDIAKLKKQRVHEIEMYVDKHSFIDNTLKIKKSNKPSLVIDIK